ncbi:hypothetical protein [Enterococcus diestrammenae]|nr:hypothetical protein [Enterococcus diestrammenae]
MIGEKKRDKKQKGKEKYKDEKDYSDVLTTIELLPFKRLMSNRQEYFELKDDCYMEILEIHGKDLSSLGNGEVQRTLLNYYAWLTDFNSDYTIYVTTLPTDTTNQINNLKHSLNKVREEMKEKHNERFYRQLQDREMILLNNIQIEEQIKEEIYNVEFFLFLFGNTAQELDELTRKAKTYGNGDFNPYPIPGSKKIQILKQYNSMNDKL